MGQLSTEYVERLREITRIKEKALKTEETSLDIAKKMQNALRNYNKDLESSKSIEEQIKKNKELINKATEEQKNILNSNKLSVTDINRLEQARIAMLAIGNRERSIELEKAKSLEERDKEFIKSEEERLEASKNRLKTLTDNMSEEARIAFQLEKQIEAMKVLIGTDEKSLELAKKRELKEKSIAALKKLTGVENISLTTIVLNAFDKLDKAQTDFQRQTGKTVDYTKAIAGTFSTGMISMSDYVKTASELTKQIGSNAQVIFSPQTIAETSILTNAMGLAVDEANNLAILSRTARVEMDKQDDAIIKNVDNFNRQNRTAFTGAQIMKDIAKTSAATTVSLGSSAEKIAKANLEARKLGLSLDQVDKIAESLLNFEQSISSELEAELLTGKNINLETARLLALNNDLEGVAKELGKNQELLNSYINGNRIQQESIAKAMGMSREEMGKMIMNQKTQLGLSDEQVQKASGLSKEDFRRLTLQENINKSIEKMAEALAAPLEMLAKLVNFANQFYGIWILLAGVALIKSINGMAKLIESVKILKAARLAMLPIEETEAAIETEKAVASGWAASMSGPQSILTGGIAGLIMGGIITAAILAATKSIGDGIFPKDGKPMVVSKEGGLFKGTANDEVVMAPGVSKLASKNPTTDPGISKLATTKSPATVVANNNAELVGKMDEFIKRQEQSNEVLRGIHKSQPKEFALNLETSKFGTAINTTTYKTK